MDVAFDHQRDGEAELAVPEPDLQLGEILRSVAELNLAPHQGRVHLVLVALEAHGRGPADAAAGCPQEGRAKQLGVGCTVASALKAFQWRLPCLCVAADVEIALDPGQKAVVELLETGDAG